ncbi:ABC transporter permease [Carboxylicivirga sp. RSCT41]|uniref:ABC transporter permease n=1 Tax=Carboxylicivirga agarovorans TaxID=3417570 RepID=UPI003D35066C
MKKILYLALKSLKYRKQTIALSVISIALSVILLMGVERIRWQVQESFSSTIAETDLIVGARNSNVTLLLATVFHLGAVSQNVSFEIYEKVSADPKVAWTIPLSLGDSHNGFPVLGTTDDFFTHFKYGKKQSLVAEEGLLCIHGMSAVIGADVAKKMDYSIGDTLFVTHGMGVQSFVEHEHDPFTIEAILKTTGTPVDQTVHVSIYAMGAIHDDFYTSARPSDDGLMNALREHQDQELHHGCQHDHNHLHQEGDAPATLTAFLVGLKNRTDVLMMQRKLNTSKGEALSAIMPVVTLMQLWSVVKPIQRALIIISFLVLIVTFAGMLTTIMTSLNERRREMAILRSVGARPIDIFRLIVLESAGIALTGILIGIIALHIMLWIAQPVISSQLGVLITVIDFSMAEFMLLACIMLIALITSIWPAYASYRHSLADGLQLKV